MKIIVKKFEFNRSWYQTDQAEFETYAEAVAFLQKYPEVRRVEPTLMQEYYYNEMHFAQKFETAHGWVRTDAKCICFTPTGPRGGFAEIWFED